jgi:hypothetical protein
MEINSSLEEFIKGPVADSNKMHHLSIENPYKDKKDFGNRIVSFCFKLTHPVTTFKREKIVD